MIVVSKDQQLIIHIICRIGINHRRGGRALGDELVVDVERGRAAVGGKLQQRSIRRGEIAILRQIGGRHVVPALVAVIDAIGGHQRRPRCHIEDNLAVAINRNSRAGAEREAQLIASELIDREGRGAAGSRIGGVVGQGEGDLGLTGFLLELPEGVEQGVDRRGRGWIGAGRTGEQYTLVEVRRAGVDGDGVEIGGGQAVAGAGGVLVDEVGELQLGLRHAADHISGRATKAQQIGRGEAVGLEKGGDTAEGDAGAQVVEPQGVAVEIGATVAIHGCGVGAIGDHGPAPGIEIGAIGSTGDGITGAGVTAPSGLLIGDAIHDEARFEQPAVGQIGVADGGGRGLAVGHQSGTVGVGPGCGLGPELNRVGRAAAARCGNGCEGRLAAAGGLGDIHGVRQHGAAAVAVDARHGGAWFDAQSADAIAGVERTDEGVVDDSEGGASDHQLQAGVGVGGGIGVSLERRAGQRLGLADPVGAGRGGGVRCGGHEGADHLGDGGAREHTDAGESRANGEGAGAQSRDAELIRCD